MSKKHNSSRLILARRILAVLAVVLFCVALFSGYMYFFGARPAPAEPEATQATVPDTFPTEAAETEDTATEAQTEPTETEEAFTEPTRETIVGEASVVPGSPGHSEVNPGGDAPSTGVDEVTPGGDEVTPGGDEVAPGGDEVAPGGDDANPAALFSAELDTDIPLTTPDDSDTEQVSEPAEASPVIEDQDEDSSRLWELIFWCSTGLLVADLIALLFVNQKIRKNRQAPKPEGIPRTALSGGFPGRRALTIGTLHQRGRRQYQQDSLGHSIVLNGKGVLAVVADGMGGLADGDKVSQQIVLRTLELGARLQGDQGNGALYRILNQVNEDINQMLTPEGLYKCGSTMIAVLVQGRSFQWISVGDSRIYLYREGYVNRLNRDHDLLQDWMPEILSGQRSMEASLADPNARKLTSFIGMGRLKYVDGSVHPIDLLPGDRLLLLSDGVYGEVSEEQMAAILKQYPDVRQAANVLGQQVQANQNSHQDNYTAMILGF